LQLQPLHILWGWIPWRQFTILTSILLLITGYSSWENSSYSNSIFRLQKRIIRTVMGVGIRDSHWEFFFKYQIFYHWLQNIYSLSFSSWLINIKFRWILRYTMPITGTILISIHQCHVWLVIKKRPLLYGNEGIQQPSTRNIRFVS